MQIGKRISYSEEKLVDRLLHDGKVSKEQIIEAKKTLYTIRSKGRPYLGKILLDCGFITQEILTKYNLARDGYYDKFCRIMVERGFLTSSNYEKVKELKKKTSNQNIAEIVIEGGFMGRDLFYKFFNNFFRVPGIGDYLTQKKLITEEQINRALDIQRMNTLEEILCARKYISVEEMEKIKGDLKIKRGCVPLVQQKVEIKNNPALSCNQHITMCKKSLITIFFMLAILLPSQVFAVNVEALYPNNGTNWNDYVDNDGSDVYSAGDITCPATGTGYSACIHGGEKRYVEATGISSCGDLAATDSLGAFDWTCDASTDPVRMISTGLKSIAALTGTATATTANQLIDSTATFSTDEVEIGDRVINTTDYTITTVTSVDSETRLTLATDIFVSGESYSIDMNKNLSDLLDFTTPGWKSNSVTVTGTGMGLPFTTTASSAWWSNTITEDNDGIASGAVSGTVYIVTADPAAIYVIDADKVALVVKPGVTLTGPGTANIISATSQLYQWIEGTIDATSDNTGVTWDTVKFSVLRNLSESNADNSGPRAGVYLTGSSNNSLSNITATDNATVGVFLNNSSNNSLSDITVVYNGEEGVYLNNSSSNSLSNITAFDSKYGVFLAASSNDNSLSNITATDNASYGVFLNNSSNNSLSNITASNNLWTGVQIYLTSSNNSLSNITAANNLWNGVNISSLSNNNTLSDITAANNTGNGVNISNSSSNSLSNITTSNNGSNGVLLGASSSNNSLSNITAVNNGNNGVWLNKASDNSLSNITAANNGDEGVLLYTYADYNSLSNITAINNLNQGVYLGASSNNTLSNITATNNGNEGVLLLTSSNNYITGLLKVGNNSSDCRDGEGDTFSDANCTVVSPSDFTLTRGVTLASSFVGKASSDTANTSDSSGTTTYPGDPTTFDWTSFENSCRAWGIDGSAFPNSDHRSQWTTGTGRIWDWSIASSDTVINGVLAAQLTGAAANTITHEWSDSSTITYLRNTFEIIGDNIGNDNGLCETDETCFYTPNIGSYQGYALVSTTFTDGDTITGVTLMEYSNTYTVDFSSAAYSGVENSGAITVTVSLNAASSDTITVSYASSDGTATAGSDYTAVSGTLTFSAGTTSQTFTVTITDDSIDENDETVTLTLSNPTNSTLAGTNNPATLTITDEALPIPTLTEWGMLLFVLLLLFSGIIFIINRRARGVR